MKVLKVENLNKRYPSFHLKDVSFSLDAGYIMGFIGSNGAGKTTTLKSILKLVKKDSGEVLVFGKDFMKHEGELKQEIGFMFGEVDYYPKSVISKITDVTKRFYKNWDEKVYLRYMKRFKLDENKKLEELSSGMRVKYSLVLALSHHAKLFIFDEPTSGLDPVARDDLLELFQELIEDGDRSILFSTHITSDLEKCADFITFIQNGQIIESLPKDDLIESYRVVKGTEELLKPLKDKMISVKKNSLNASGLIKTRDYIKTEGILSEAPTLEEIMIYYDKKGAAK